MSADDDDGDGDAFADAHEGRGDGRDGDGNDDDVSHADNAGAGAEATAAPRELTAEELASAIAQALVLKTEGNDFYAHGQLNSAIEKYSEGISILPDRNEHRAVLFANRAACYFKQEKYESVIEDTTKCIKIDKGYVKALLRRMEAYEKLQKYAEALLDMDELIRLQPADKTLPPRKEKMLKDKAAADEKLKEEMLAKLKDLGNTLLGKFGLSTDNFQFVKDDKGGYSVNFNNNGSSSNK